MKNVRNILDMRKKSKWRVLRIKKAVIYDENVTLLPHSASIGKDVRFVHINVRSTLLPANACNE